MLGFRPFSSSEHAGHRFGFQGQEKDDEVKGNGNSINYKFRIHDPRIGRFFAVDPLTAKHPYYSPYAFSGNRVIDRIEMEGLEPDFPPLPGQFRQPISLTDARNFHLQNPRGDSQKRRAFECSTCLGFEAYLQKPALQMKTFRETVPDVGTGSATIMTSQTPVEMLYYEPGSTKSDGSPLIDLGDIPHDARLNAVSVEIPKGFTDDTGIEEIKAGIVNQFTQDGFELTVGDISVTQSAKGTEASYDEASFTISVDFEFDTTKEVDVQRPVEVYPDEVE